MHKRTQTLDGEVIDVAIEYIWMKEEKRWMTEQEILEQYPFPAWNIHYLQGDVFPGRVGSIALKENKVVLTAGGKAFPISGRDFLDLLFPRGLPMSLCTSDCEGYGEQHRYIHEQAGKIYAQLLSLLWKSREEVASLRSTIKAMEDND